jgi:predicted nucleotidyltransferase
MGVILCFGKNSLVRNGWQLWKKSDESFTDGKMILNKDFKEFFESLNNNNVRYLVIGGYAVAVHGHPRYTRDIDIWLELSPDNASRVIKAIEEFGFGSLGLKKEDFLEPTQVVQLGYPPIRIDLLTSIKGVVFEECYLSRVELTISGIKLNFIDLDNLKKNKQATGRHQDLADLENLESGKN